MNAVTWLLAAAATLGACALVILIEYGIDAIFDNGEIDDLY